MVDKIRAHVFIEGQVQGVFYRAWAARTAQGLRLTGWVRNLADGRVEAVIEGKSDQVNQLIELIKEGPRLAEVEHIDVNWEQASGEFDEFRVAR